MTAINSPVILVGENTVRLSTLQEAVQSCDRYCVIVPDIAALVSACEDSVSQLVVLVSSDSSS